MIIFSLTAAAFAMFVGTTAVVIIAMFVFVMMFMMMFVRPGSLAHSDLDVFFVTGCEIRKYTAKHRRHKRCHRP